MKKLIFNILTITTLATMPLFSFGQTDEPALRQSQGPKNPEALQLTLEQALEIALSESNTIKIADMTVEKTGYARKGSYAALYPNVSINGSYQRTLQKQVMVMDMGGQAMEIKVGRDNNISTSATASMPLVNAQLWESLKLSGMDVELAVEQARSSKIAMVKQVKQAFYAVLLAQRSLDVVVSVYENAQKNYEKIDVENEKVAEYARLSDDGQEPPTVDWESLRAMNPDIVGWLQVPGTIINYPVYQSYDNEYYLEHAPDRSDSIGGSVFLDFESIAPGMVDAQTIIYGHHMRNGSQFKPIADMDSQELFDGVNRVWYVTEKGAYDLAPLFLFYTTETDTYVRQFAFDSPEAFHDYLNTYYANAVTKRADADAIIAGASRVLTLSTCNYYDGYGRTLLVCVPRYEIPGTAEYEQYHAQAAAVAAAQAAAEAEAAAAAAAEPAPEG